MYDEPHTPSTRSDVADEREPNADVDRPIPGERASSIPGGSASSIPGGSAPSTSGESVPSIPVDDEPPPDHESSSDDAGGTDDPEECDDAGGTDDPEESDDDFEPLEYRLERLRLWRTLATLAVVIARLIRSL